MNRAPFVLVFNLQGGSHVLGVMLMLILLIHSFFFLFVLVLMLVVITCCETMLWRLCT